MQLKSKASHDNCFDILRHLAALTVIFSHHLALSGMDEPELFGLTSYGSIAVYIFFAISGYLITQSFERRKSTAEYVKKRFFRIYPGLFICLIFTVYVCCGFFGRMGVGNWVTSLEPIKTFLKALIITGYGTVYATQQGMNYFTADYLFKDTMNGSLWTLLFEIIEYIMIALVLSLFRNKNLAVSIPLLLATILLIYCNAISVAHMKLISLGFLTIPFCIGALLYINKDKWFHSGRIKAVMFTAPWIMLYLSTFSVLFSDALISAAIALLSIVVGTTFKDRLIKGRFDFSYGIYIYAFPVQQIIINVLGMGLYSSMVLSMLVSILLAIISWFMVEKPAIEWSRRTSKRPENLLPAERSLDESP